MDAFECGTHHQGARVRHIKELGALEKQERPQSLAGAEEAIAHGRDEPSAIARNQAIEKCIDLGRRRPEEAFEARKVG
jgi:hypothetical protein